MPYFDTSLTTTKSLDQARLGIDIDQVISSSVLTPPSPAVSQSINDTVGTVTNNPLNTANVVQKAASTYLASAIKSTKATFDTATKSLAGGISPILGSLFVNTNNSKSSTTTTLISDPVNTNLLSKQNPGSGTFKVDSLQTGSNPLSSKGATSVFGTGAASMQGVNLTTLLNRFNLDLKSITSLPNALSTNKSSNQLSGLFANLSVGAGSLAGSLVGSALDSTSLGGLAAGVTTGLVASSLGVSSSPIVARAEINDLSVFLGITTPTAKALGYGGNSTALSGYFVTNPSHSLINSTTGAGVNTSKSGVDATTANAILAAFNKTGCTTSITNYGSAHVQASSFNMSLELAAINGMVDLVASLLGCSHASTAMGQRSLTNAFSAASSSQINVSSQILQSIQAPDTLNTPTTALSILTNPSLSASDVGTINSIFATIGTTTKSAYTSSAASSDKYPVYDVSLLAQTQPSFLDAAFNSKDFTNYLNGTPMTITNDGSLDLFYS